MSEPDAEENPHQPTADPGWVLSEDGYDPPGEASRETRFAVSNGFLGVKGAPAIHQGGRAVLPTRTFVAGLFDTGDASAGPALVPAADWALVRLTVNGEPLARSAGDASTLRLTLDLRRGVLLSDGRQSIGSAIGLRMRTLRLVSLSDRAIGLQLVKLQVDGGDVDIALEASSEGVSVALMPERLEQDLGVWRTKHSGKRLATATTSLLQIDGIDLAVVALGEFHWRWHWTARPGQIACFAHTVAVARSEAEGRDPGPAARGKLEAARQLGWRGVIAEHEAAWAERWQCSDVEIDGDAEAQGALRFALYHLNSSANPADECVSIAARALTGDDYRGHVFWDTEIFLLPFYTLTWPQAARALLMYRYHTLDAARAKASRLGWRGALYAWESAATGAETTPEHVIGPDGQPVQVLAGREEQHISADIAHAVWQYWLATGDDTFLLDAGAEILLETGRFWASRAQLEADGRHHIRGVIGPDEYHDDVDDNAYTNVMARWNIQRAQEIAALLRQRWPERWELLSRRLGLNDAELRTWLDVAETVVPGYDAQAGLFEQFEGYFELEDIDLADYADRAMPIDVVLGPERTRRSQVIKQADVVALLGVLPEVFPVGAAADNFHYYEARCAHGSSLSRVTHGLVAARLGHPETALRYFRQAAAIDLADSQGSIAGGVHIADQGGLWLIAVFGFAGVSLRADGVALEPHLPAEWRSLSFRVQWRGRRLKIRIDQADSRVEATLEAGEPMKLTLGRASHELGLGHPLRTRRLKSW